MNRIFHSRRLATVSLAAWALLLPALLLPAAGHAQDDNCIITVANGKATNSYVPVYGFYCDNYLRCQIMYPAAKIAEGQFMTDVTHGQYTNVIKSMTFHLASPAAGSWGNAQFVVRVKEIPASISTIGSSYWDMSDATLVYSDSLNAMGGTMVVNFSSALTYSGGNLLVEIENTAIGSYKSCSWLGQSYAGASLSGYSSTSVAACPATSRNFLPMTTITFGNTGLATGAGNAVTVGNESSTATSYSYPVNNYYNYSLSETIIDQNELDGPGIIKSLSLKYTASTPMTAKGDVTIWMQPTTKSTFASSDDLEPLNASTAVKVYQGPLNCAQGWNEFVLTTPYDYDGNGNLMVIVDDNSGDYNGTSRTFATSSTSGNKTLAWCSDVNNPDPTSGSFNGTKNVYNSRVLMRVNKAQAGPVLKYVDFHDGTATNNLWTGTGYSTGVVTSGVEAHGQTADYSFWQRIAGTGAAAQSTVSSLFPYFYSHLSSWDYLVGQLQLGVSSADNGFMMMSLIDQRADLTGNFNAYINLGVVNASQAPVVDVRLYQYYKKYYDHCYIDWRTSSTGAWNSMEINVTGEDVGVNSYLLGFRTYTLPLAAAGQSYLELRLRYTSLDSHHGNAYGYYWIVDDVSVLAGEANRLVKMNEEYAYGGYGIVPQTMKIKPAWYSMVNNTGANAQTNVTVSMNHMNASQTATSELGSNNNGNVAATTQGELVLDPDGWFDPEQLDYRGWDGYANHSVHHGTCTSLPSATVGDNYLFASVTTAQGVELTYDTMHYSVSGLDNAAHAYTWAKDNGVLCYSPWNYYVAGMTRSNNNWYFTEDPEDAHYDRAGYELTLRYTTGSEVPAGWVIRGMEMVAAPVAEFQDAVSIIPVLMRDEYDGDNVSFYNVVTGAGVHQITTAEMNGVNVIGRNSNGYLEQGSYNTIRIMFPEQPALQPSTSYRVGYKLAGNGSFAVATAMKSYRLAKPSDPDIDTIIYFRNNPATKKYSSIFGVNQYDVRVIDPVYDSSRTMIVSTHKDDVPMIRLLVGPAQAGIREVRDIKVSAYPNPTNGLLTVSTSENITLIEVFGVNGTLVRSLRCSGNSADVDLSDLQAGTYMLSVHTAIGIAHERVVVK